MSPFLISMLLAMSATSDDCKPKVKPEVPRMSMAQLRAINRVAEVASLRESGCLSRAEWERAMNRSFDQVWDDANAKRIAKANSDVSKKYKHKAWLGE